MDVNNENENLDESGIELGGAAAEAEAHSNASIIIDELDYQPNQEDPAPQPGESTDPSLDTRSVEEILGQELQVTEANLYQHSSSDLQAAPEMEVASICLQIPLVEESRRPALHAALEECGISLNEEELRSPKLSRLQEAHAIQIMQSLSRADFTAKISVQWPEHPSPFTDDDVQEVLPEGAPSVVLPSSTKAVLLASTNEMPGFSVLQNLGLVSAHKSLSRRFFKEEDLQNDLDRELKKMQRSFANPFARSSFERVLRELSSELQRKALNLGANAVVGIRIECHAEAEHLDPSLDQMRLIAIGTASVVEK